MNSFVDACCWKCKRRGGDSDDEEQLLDKDAKNLSHVGEAVHAVLGRKHRWHHHSQWNVTRGRLVGPVDDTPRNVWGTAADPETDHDDWFPQKIGRIIGRTEAFCDIMSLGPPDGKFLTAFKDALLQLAKRSMNSPQPIIVRMMFGNIAGMPVNCGKVIKVLTRDLPEDANLHLWVGAWRRNLSWNHAKLIAVDGVFLHTGGHNLWDAHYLAKDPVHDLSFQLEGPVARDGHRFADQQWRFVEVKQRTCLGYIVNKMPDNLEVAKRSRVTVSAWPKHAVPSKFPPQFAKDYVADTQNQSILSNQANYVPLISIGRQGSMVYRHRPSDDAILAMINSSRTIIRLVIQDLGPVCLPGTKQALPGLTWPKKYLAAIGKAIYERGVDIEMVLSNPNSIPGGLKGTEANYGNGWSCVDVAAEIVKRIQKQYSKVDDARLRVMIGNKLRICFVRHHRSATYRDGTTIGMHSKHFIVDDRCCYIGSQNLYVCDLAEWGVVVDHEEEVQRIMRDYFDPLWRDSYTGEDVDVAAVMDVLNVDRDGKPWYRPKLERGERWSLPGRSSFRMPRTARSGRKRATLLMPHGTGSEYYDVDVMEDVEEDVEGDKDVLEAPLL